MESDIEKQDPDASKYWITLDERRVASKPNDQFKATITRNLTKRRLLTIAEFARLITQPFGYTWSPGRFDGKRSNSTWLDQQVFALDFDKGTITVEEVITAISQFGFKPQLWYSTFSDTPELRKFRVVFFLDSTIKDINLHKMIYESLMSLFPDADKSCKDASRYFYGGKDFEIVHQEPIRTSLFLDALSIQLTTSDSGKFRKLPLSSEYYTNRTFVSKRTFYYSSNTNVQIETDLTSAHHPTSREGSNLVVIDIEKARKKIRILDEFINGTWLHHPKLFGLATNLLKIRGGYQLMKNTMEKNNKAGKTKYNTNNFNILPYIKKVNYTIQPIFKFSPYLEDADIYDVISTTKDIRGQIEYESIERISLNKAEEMLAESFQKVLREGEKGKIYLFKMPTALGKTETLIGTKATIALPTNALKNEIAERINNKNNDGLAPMRFVTTPDPVEFESEEINAKMRNYYSAGLPNKSMELIQHISKYAKTESYSYIDTIKARNYLDQFAKSLQSSDTILTTHKRALFTEFSNTILIFDEDPLSSLLEIKQLKISDLFLLNEAVNDLDVENLITYLKKATPHKIEQTPLFEINLNQLIDRISKIKSPSNIFEFFDSSFFMRDGANDEDKNPQKLDIIHYIKRKELPKDKVVIIMSATIPIPIYEILFGDRIVVYDIKDVQQQGKVIQYTKKSCSRKGLTRYGKEISKEVGDQPVITFKSMADIFKKPVDKVWFGNCSGYDNLKGMDIAVVGTPHRNPLEYLLYAKALNIDLKTSDTAMSHKKIEYNGFKFMMNCYDNERLRAIQLSLIESDLIQAVGRARTLRTDATVKVYSNFPLRMSDNFVF